MIILRNTNRPTHLRPLHKILTARHFQLNLVLWSRQRKNQLSIKTERSVFHKSYWFSAFQETTETNQFSKKQLKNQFPTTNFVLQFWMVFGRSRGVQGHGMNHTFAIPSNFGRVWSYMAWGKSIFMFLGNIGNSLHHQIPPNWSSGLQIGPRIFLKARAPSQEL